MAWRLALASALLVAGCIAPAPVEAPIGTRSADALMSSENEGFLFGELASLGIVDIGAEPALALGPDEDAYVASVVGPYFWRSDDGARSFEMVGDPCLSALVCVAGHPGMEGGGDAAIVTLANGTLAWLGLGGTPEDVPFQRSFDRGATWTRSKDLANAPSGSLIDRQWLTLGPGGELYATWRQIEDERAVVLFRASYDGGATWTAERVVGPDGQTGELAVDANTGTLYVPIFDYADSRQLDIARSIDGGASWERARVANPPVPLVLFWPQVAVDDAGNVYATWAQDPDPLLASDPAPALGFGLDILAASATGVPAVFLSVSRDAGATWGPPAIISTPGKPALFPQIVAGAEGRVAVAFYEGDLGLPGSRFPELWWMTLAWSLDASAPSPAFARQRTTEDPIRVGPMCSDGGNCLATAGDRTSAEAFGLRLREDGLPTLAFTRDAPIRGATVEVVAQRVEDGPRLR